MAYTSAVNKQIKDQIIANSKRPIIKQEITKWDIEFGGKKMWAHTEHGKPENVCSSIGSMDLKNFLDGLEKMRAAGAIIVETKTDFEYLA